MNYCANCNAEVTEVDESVGHCTQCGSEIEEDDNDQGT